MPRAIKRPYKGNWGAFFVRGGPLTERPIKRDIGLTRAKIHKSSDVKCGNRATLNKPPRFGVGSRALGVGLNGSDASEGTDAGALLDRIARSLSCCTLGGGDHEETYPIQFSYIDERE